jgi:hypothetical protein
MLSPLDTIFDPAISPDHIDVTDMVMLPVFIVVSPVVYPYSANIFVFPSGLDHKSHW